MDWQRPVALGIVAVTAGIFLWRRFRPRPRFSAKGLPCGCANTSGSGTLRPPTYTVTSRRGQAPQVIVHPPKS